MTPNAIDGYSVEQLRAIDAMVAEKIFGGQLDGYVTDVGCCGLCPGVHAKDVFTPKPFTTDGNAMLEVLEKMKEREDIVNILPRSAGWSVRVMVRGTIVDVPDLPLPLAVCLAALLAVGVDPKAWAAAEEEGEDQAGNS